MTQNRLEFDKAKMNKTANLKRMDLDGVKTGSVASYSSRKEKIAQRRGLKRKMAINPFVDSFLFPNMDIRIIHKISRVEEI